MAKKPMKKRPPPPPQSFSTSSDEEAPSPSFFPVKKLSASPSLKPADGEQEEEKEEEESSEDSEYAAPKRSHQAAPRVSRNTANDLKLEKPSAANKIARTVSMAEDDESSESEEEEYTDEESSEDSENAVREPNPQTQRRDSQTANDGKHEFANTYSSSDSGTEDGKEDSEELNSRSKSEQLLPPPPPKPTGNAVNPIADPLLKIPNSAKSVDGGEDEMDLESEEEEEEESTADESSEGFGNTVAKENTGPQPRDSQNLDDKQASDTSSSSGSGLGDDEEDTETPISDALLVPLSCKPIDSSVQPIEKEPNSGIQPAASPAQISKKKRTADIVGVEGGQEREHFRRIWSNEDELALLQGIMEYKEQHHIIPYTHMHAESLLKYVKDSLSISVSVNQINDKARRLKRRYINTSIRQNLAKKSKISDPHNAAVFDLSKKIWDSVKEESILLEKKIPLDKKENFNKKKVGLKHTEEEYPSLYLHLRSEHANNALLLQNHIPIANAKKWEETCKKLEMIDVELNMQKIEFLSSAMKLIKDALAKC